MLVRMLWVSHAVKSNSASLWTAAHQAPLSMGFSRQEYWSGLPFPPPRDLPNLRIKPESPLSLSLQVDSLPAETLGKLVLCSRTLLFIHLIYIYNSLHLLSESLSLSLFRVNSPFSQRKGCFAPSWHLHLAWVL